MTEPEGDHYNSQHTSQPYSTNHANPQLNPQLYEQHENYPQEHLSSVFPTRNSFEQPMYAQQEPVNYSSHYQTRDQTEADTAARFIPPPENDTPSYVQHPGENFATHVQREDGSSMYNHQLNKESDSETFTPDVLQPSQVVEPQPSESPPDIYSEKPTENVKPEENDSEDEEEEQEDDALSETEGNGVASDAEMPESESVDDSKTETVEEPEQPMYHIRRRRLVASLRPQPQHEPESDETSPTKSYTEDEKLRIIHQAKIYGIDKAAEKYNIPKNTIMLWKKTLNKGKPLRGRGRPKGSAARTVVMDRAVQCTFAGERSLQDILGKENGEANAECIDAEPDVADIVEAYPNDCAIKVRRRRTQRKKKPITYSTEDYYASKAEDDVGNNILADFAQIVADIEMGYDEEDDDIDYEEPRRRRRGRHKKKRFTGEEKIEILEYAKANSMRTTTKKFKVPFSTVIKWKEIVKNGGELMDDSTTSLGGSGKRRGNQPNVPRGPYKKYNLSEKQEVVHYAQTHSLRAAADKFKMPVSTVMAWKHEQRGPQVKRNVSTGRKIGSGRQITYSPQVDSQIVNWVTTRKEQGTHVGIRDICQYAQTLVKNEKPDSKFKASHGWVTKFLKRHNIKLEKCRKRRPHIQGECGKTPGTSSVQRKPRQPKHSLPPMEIPDVRREITPIPTHDRGPSQERNPTPPGIQYGQYGEIPSQVPVFSHNYMYGLSPLPPASASHTGHNIPNSDTMHTHSQPPSLPYNSWIPSAQSNTLTYATHAAPTHQPPQAAYWSDFVRPEYHHSTQ